jgi:hypothetical protein
MEMTYFLCLLLELFLEVLKKVGVEVLTTKVSVTSGGLDREDTTLDVKKGNIESSSTEIVDENVALLVGLAGAEAVGDSGCGRLVDDTEDVEASDGTGVLGGLSLVVVEVGGDGDDGLLDLLGELGLGNLLHLDKDHGGDLLGRESLLLSEVLDLDLGGSIVVNDLERPGLNVLLDGGVIESAADKTPGVPVRNCSIVCSSRSSHSLDIEDGVDGVHGGLVLGGLTNQTLLSGEGDE